MNRGNESDKDEWEDLTPEISDEELEREIDNGEFYTTDEVIQMIKDQQRKQE
jgi:hypothetical protein